MWQLPGLALQNQVGAGSRASPPGKIGNEVSSPVRDPDLSVVIVSWNTRELLLQCLVSVRAEQRRSELDLEIIVVDNASTDGSAEAVRAADSDVVVLAQSENLGFAAANNLGIEHARGNALLILNPDTELQPESLGRLWRTLVASEHIGLVSPVLLNTDGSFQTAGFQFPGLVQTFLDLYPLHPRLMGSQINGRYDRGDGRSPFRIDHPLGACMLVRREIVDTVGAFDPGYFVYSEEIDWCRRMSDAGWTILCAPSATVIHHGGQSTSQAPDRMQAQLHRSRARYFLLHENERFRRRLRSLMDLGISLKRSRLPLPSGGRTIEELQAIAGIYEETCAGASDD